MGAGARAPLLLLPAAGPRVVVPPALAASVDARPYDGWPVLAGVDDALPVACVLDAAVVRDPPGGAEALSMLADRVAVVVRGAGAEPPAGLPEAACGYLPAEAPPATVRFVLSAALRVAEALAAAREAARRERALHRELSDVVRIGAALSTERDLEALLGMILTQARALAQADAGSLYLVERRQDGQPPDTLRFKLAQNDSIPDLPFAEFAVPIDERSAAGWVAATGMPLLLADVYDLPPGTPFTFNRSFDQRFGYRTRSMLVLPMRTHRDETVGVLQLINRTERTGMSLRDTAAVRARVVPFDDRAVELVTALASQAAVAVENAQLYEEIERLFEGFVTASVTAIEQRDPVTSGHSGRVAALTMGLAEVVARGDAGGPYAALRLSRTALRELRYAALLHDFGKVGVRELVLGKEKKLYPWDLALIRERFATLARHADLEYERARADVLHAGGPAVATTLAALVARRDARCRDLAASLEIVERANEPSGITADALASLAALAGETYVDAAGAVRPVLTEDEVRLLTIPRGNLDERERREIESHVTHSFRFLERIPWTRELRDIPRIAYGHHEKLDGTGYPRGIAADDIPVQTRMMTIADIFDALTASDRPYKRALPVPRALDILRREAQAGAIDPHLLEAFIAHEVWRVVLPEA